MQLRDMVKHIWSSKDSYSHRKGLIALESLIQRNKLNQRTRTKISDCFFEFYSLLRKFNKGKDYKLFFRNLCADIFSCSKYSLETNENFVRQIQVTIDLCNYNEVFDFCEKVYKDIYASEKDIWEMRLNAIFEKEAVCHRMVNGLIVDELSNEDMQSVKEASEGEDEASTFIQKALHALYKLHDTNTAVLHSVSAAESILKQKAGNTKGTLADASKKLNEQGKLHRSLSDGLVKIYGYTSDVARHASGEKKTPIPYEEAKYIFLFCSSTVNFLRSFEDRSA